MSALLILLTSYSWGGEKEEESFPPFFSLLSSILLQSRESNSSELVSAQPQVSCFLHLFIGFESSLFCLLSAFQRFDKPMKWGKMRQNKARNSSNRGGERVRGSQSRQRICFASLCFTSICLDLPVLARNMTDICITCYTHVGCRVARRIVNCKSVKQVVTTHLLSFWFSFPISILSLFLNLRHNAFLLFVCHLLYAFLVCKQQ